LKLLAFDALESVVPCANRTLIGCNWSVDDGHPFCHSCRLTQTIPNLASNRNVMLWKRVETAKRRLVYDLARLGLPLAVPQGQQICFDILSEETAGFPILTGHLAGLITLSLAEADDAERETRRVAFREPYRTLLGHFRHEVGHFYWEVLVDGTNLQSAFRLIFGDESRSYENALKAYHARTDRAYDRAAFISEYATSHPWEDWAETFAHFLHIVADSSAALEIKSEDERHFSQLVAETGALFGARHYRSYHFLLTLSDYVAHFGLEHHESSDNRQAERYLIDEDPRKLGAFLLPHEMTHSWNGKYRRPAGLVTPDFHQPMNGELLWIYEGLTDYLGCLLATRCGLWTNTNFRDYLAIEAAKLDREPGRQWRPLADTTVAAQLLYMARPEGAARRRSTDFYQEGDLIWLEVDVLIRQQSQGRRSLNDFCKRFHGGQNGPPAVVPYTLDNVIATLNEISPRDWKQFFQKRVYATNPRAPLGGIEGAGWRLAYTNTIPEMFKLSETANKLTDLTFSLGLIVKEDGAIQDVIPGSPAHKAGVAPAMKLLAVAALCAAAAASRAACADCAAAPAFESTSEMRPSFLRVRSCVSSIARPCESTFSFTSPTLVRTNFLVAQAVDPPIVTATIGTAMKNFRNMIDPPNTPSGLIAPRCNRSGRERSGPCCARGPRADASPACRSIRMR